MKMKNVLTIVFGSILILGAGLLTAFHSGTDDSKREPRKIKMTIVKDVNGVMEKSEEVIEVKSKEDVNSYLKSKSINVDELDFYGGKGHGKPHHHPGVWVLDKTGGSDVSKGEVVVKTIRIDDSDVTEEQNVRIEKKVDEEGNVVVRKWINGEEVDPNTRVKNPMADMKEEGSEVLVELKDENGEVEKVIKIKKELDADGNMVVLRSVNGGEFEKVEHNHPKKHCDKADQKGNSCKSGKEAHGDSHKGHGPKGFAARSKDGSVMVFGVPVNEKGEEKVKKNNQEDNEILNIEDVTFYPNPTESRFSIAFNTVEKGTIEIEVKDIQGKEILKKDYDHNGGEFKQELELIDVDPGMYIFNVKQNGKTFTHKLMVR